MKVRWSENAVHELDEILSFIAERNASAARAVANLIWERTRLLGEFPLAGHKTDLTTVRALSVVRYPFVIFHKVDEAKDEVVILSVRNTARRDPTRSE
ncbi:type II toxin-antitoxin system RelE/ParE family toxin [Rhodopseudomonas sp. BR0M22]|uniref:type II toxin-antitoxin system RelE/ParE family toxin n=1 Tax=Rhodopseudomonas sp. BR0M22 TaxID=2269369 RepID=UPI0013DEA71E|nr:type II toxin-antitoxin system RelE/ParE family toxin [Rhodopseudomonas sp. BR0M22]NEW91876.1 type II toxin-antitoxin system RelE/ParE family toxin [Rhodopseudomonas sp. BR0M22]